MVNSILNPIFHSADFTDNEIAAGAAASAASAKNGSNGRANSLHMMTGQEPQGQGQQDDIGGHDEVARQASHWKYPSPSIEYE